MTEFSRITRGMERRGQAHHLRKRWGPSPSQLLGVPSTSAFTLWHRTTQIWRGNLCEKGASF